MAPTPGRRALAAIVVLLTMAACTSGGDGPEPATGPDAASLRGGVLRVAVADAAAFLVDLDPQSYSYASWELARCCLLRTLYSYNGKPADEGGAEVRPDLAEGMPEVSSDGLTWTFHLKRGLRYAPPFEDTPIVALDIVRGLERQARAGMHLPPGEDYGKIYYSEIRGFDQYPERADSIVGLEHPDDHTLIVRLKKITGDLPYRFSLPATAPIPEGAFEGHDADYGRFLVASGPYMVEGSEDLDFSVPPGQQKPASGFVPATIKKGEAEEPGSLVLVRNPSWDPLTDGLRPAYPDRIELAIGGGDDEEFAERVDASEIDVVFDVEGSPFEQVARYREDPALEDRLHVHASDAGYAITMNLAVPPFDDVHVRRAVSLAIDETALVELAEQADVPLASFSEAGTHIAPDTFEGLLLQAFDPYPYDPAEAREEMRASGYDRTGDGVCDAQVCRNLRAPVFDSVVIPIPQQAEEVHDNLAEVGIELVLEPHSGVAFFDLIENPRRRIPIGIGYPWGKDYPEGTGWFLGLFDRSGLEGANTSLVGATPAELREWGYQVTSVPTVDDRLDACQQRRGVARTQCWAELDQYLMTEVVPRVPYIFMDNAVVVSERVVGYSFSQFTSLPALDQIALAPGSE